MGWRRRSQAKPGVPFIPDREELAAINAPLQRAAEERKRKNKGGGKSKHK